MEGQITLTEWMQWREDIRKKLQETAGNFVYIGYRLKQIRDSGMYDGCTDIFEFAQKEYGLGKSVVSRFIAINEKFSEGGNSLEIRAEYRALGSSKLSEMLTLSDEDCQLITTETTVKEIREIKHFNKQTTAIETGEEVQYTPLQKCIIDFFKSRKEVLREVIYLLDNDWQIDRAAKVVNPGDYITHKKGIVFLFMYDFRNGVAYKLMGQPEPIKISWDTFFYEVDRVYGTFEEDDKFDDIWNRIYPEEKQQKTEPKMPENRENTPVATSQQSSGKEEELPPQDAVEITEKEEADFTEDNKIAEENHISQAEKMVAEDHGVDVNEMVPKEHISDAGKMISEERVVDVGKTLEEASEEEVPVATEPVKLTEDDVEELPAEKPSIWEDMVYRDFQELKGDMENKNWQLAFITARKLMSHLETLIKEEQK